MGWPEGITPQAHVNRELWIGAVIASLVVGVIVWGLIFWSAAFHRKKATDTELPRQFGYNMPLELVLTVTPFLIISVLFYFTVVVQEKMLHLAKDPEVVIDVTSFQWNWKFGYQRVELQRRHVDLRRRRRGPQEGHDVQAGGQGQARRGARRPGARAQHRGPDLPELRQGRDPGNQHRNSGAGAAGRQAHRIPSGIGRRRPRILGARIPVQARRDAQPRWRTTRSTCSRSKRSPRPGRSSDTAPRCAARITR